MSRPDSGQNAVTDSEPRARCSPAYYKDVIDRTRDLLLVHELNQDMFPVGITLDHTYIKHAWVEFQSVMWKRMKIPG